MVLFFRRLEKFRRILIEFIRGRDMRAVAGVTFTDISREILSVLLEKNY